MFCIGTFRVLHIWAGSVIESAQGDTASDNTRRSRQTDGTLGQSARKNATSSISLKIAKLFSGKATYITHKRYEWIGSISCHKIATINSRFHLREEGVNRLLLALQSEPYKCESTWSLFSWVCLLFRKWESTSREMHVFPGKIVFFVTPLPATCTVLYPLAMHSLP